ncbi:unnamed protein product [Schistocephalus solidus]|uniref:Uncharacterized protein n=1 Tax=Schistocephalus solidus TaxID=70667 RepID=A0A183SCR0_SCHSO|nr:unnamed protein product [Schistocephalus solidus]
MTQFTLHSPTPPPLIIFSLMPPSHPPSPTPRPPHPSCRAIIPPSTKQTYVDS